MIKMIRKSRLNFFILILVAALLVLQYRLWFESDGIRDMLKLKQTLGKQEAENDKLRKHNDELLSQIKQLQDSQEPQNRVLGMSWVW